ncbi:MAG: hypothetical protein ACK559_41535 [bacterium]
MTHPSANTFDWQVATAIAALRYHAASPASCSTVIHHPCPLTAVAACSSASG